MQKRLWHSTVTLDVYVAAYDWTQAQELANFPLYVFPETSWITDTTIQDILNVEKVDPFLRNVVPPGGDGKTCAEIVAEYEEKGGP